MRVFICIVSCCFLFGCLGGSFNKMLELDLKKSVEFYDSKFTDHFPRNLSNSVHLKTNVISSVNISEYAFCIYNTFLSEKYFDEKYASKLKELLSIAEASYFADDEKLLLLFPYNNKTVIEGQIFNNLESKYKRALAKSNVSDATSLPVPLLDINSFAGSTRCGLTEDFKLAVLDASPGVYLDKQKLRNCECLPEKWKHGYSKGIAYSDEKRVIIYWIAVW